MTFLKAVTFAVLSDGLSLLRCSLAKSASVPAALEIVLGICRYFNMAAIPSPNQSPNQAECGPGH